MKKLMCLLLVLLLTMTSLAPAALAASFSDVTAENHGWAMAEISAMAEMGIIAGYPDGTFQPDSGITKLQGLLLTARILGVDNAAYTQLLPTIEQQYEAALSRYNIAYNREVAFLLNRGVLAESELDSYISDSNKDMVMKRYEVAILVTKLMGAETSVRQQETAMLSFADKDEIPQSARAYVQFVCGEGIMQGMPGNIFSPNTDVTRAQIAVMLKRSLDACDISYLSGVYYSYNYAGKSISMANVASQIVNIALTSTTTVKYGGQVVTGDQIPQGAYMAITKFGNEVVSVDAVSVAADETVSGVVRGTDIMNGRNIYIYSPLAAADTAVQYRIADGCFITKNGIILDYSQIKAKDYAKLSVSGEFVTSIEITDAEQTVRGTVVSITTENPVTLVIADSTGSTITLPTYSDCKVTKNSAPASLRDVYPGQSITATTEYGAIRSITFTVTNETVEGTISEIKISQYPSITITRNGQAYEYSIAQDAVITVEKVASDIYGLRLGYQVSLTLQSSVITKLTTKSIVETNTITGTVTDVNESYGFINVLPAGSDTAIQIFPKKDATIIFNNSSAPKAIKDIKVGNLVTCVGGYVNGTFEASTIVIINQ